MADRTKRVLVVDDAGLVRRFYREALERRGFAVEEALNGIEALERVLQGEPVDLLIVDINMPQMDGLTFIQKLRQQKMPLAATPAMITSTESKAKDVEAARAAGANFYLSKPVSQETLADYAALMCGAPA